MKVEDEQPSKIMEATSETLEDKNKNNCKLETKRLSTCNCKDFSSSLL